MIPSVLGVRVNHPKQHPRLVTRSKDQPEQIGKHPLPVLGITPGRLRTSSMSQDLDELPRFCIGSIKESV